MKRLGIVYILIGPRNLKHPRIKMGCFNWKNGWKSPKIHPLKNGCLGVPGKTWKNVKFKRLFHGPKWLSKLDENDDDLQGLVGYVDDGRGLGWVRRFIIMAGQPTSPPYQGKLMVNKPLTRPYFWGG